MTPLAPLYLLGALAVAGPILFHLWRRTPRGHREFSTLMFLTPSPPRFTSRSRIEHWLLLLLRGIIVCLLAFAFARPMWRTPASIPEKSADEELVALLVDTSASLRRSGTWSDLVRQIDLQLSRLPATATAALFQFSDRWTTLADFNELKRLQPEARRALVKERLKDLKPTWGGTNLGEALVRTAGSLQEAQTERSIPAKLRILLASDYQSGANIDALHGFEWPADLRVEPLIPEVGSTSNAGLQLVERNLDLVDEALRVRVSNSADSRKEQFTLKWNAGDSAAQSVYVPPGQSRVVMPPKRPANPAATSLILTGDDHDFDNSIHIAPVKDETKLVVYCGDDKPDDIEGLRFYLEGVFAASHRYKIVLTAWRDALPTIRVERPTMVVIAEAEADTSQFLMSYLTQGGTVLIAAKSAEAGNESLKQCGLTGLSMKEAAISRDAMLGDIDFEHPLFAPFAESQFSDFTGIRFWKHRSLSGLGATGNRGAVEEAGKGHVLARFDDGDVALVEFPVAKGRVWVMTGAWHPADSQLARSSKFPPLVFRMLEHATGTLPRPGSVMVGSEVAWPARTPDDGLKSGTVRRPDGSEQSDISTETPFTATDQPGLYSLTVDGRTETVAVNLSPDESRTAPLQIENLESLGVRFGVVETAEQTRRVKDRERQLQIEELEQTQKLWRWGLVVAIVILLAETWLAGRRVDVSSTSESVE